ncbi:hypothetical protein [Paraburkholderia sediminicola]|uniref:hypothetical protein n=1 Tax=Paraburkholderia sediminicola TaxID=458836 RepID=UPI0038BA1EC1
MESAMETRQTRELWNKGKLIGQKPPLEPKEIWAIRIHLQNAHSVRDLALFNVAIDSKLRGWPAQFDPVQTVIILRTVRRVSESSGHSRNEMVGGFSAEARSGHRRTARGISAAAIDALIDVYRAGVAIATRRFSDERGRRSVRQHTPPEEETRAVSRQ